MDLATLVRLSVMQVRICRSEIAMSSHGVVLKKWMQH